MIPAPVLIDMVPDRGSDAGVVAPVMEFRMLELEGRIGCKLMQFTRGIWGKGAAQF